MWLHDSDIGLSEAPGKLPAHLVRLRTQKRFAIVEKVTLHDIKI